MRFSSILLLSLGALAGCLLEPDESTPSGDEGIGSRGVEGTGSEGEVTSCPTPTNGSTGPTNCTAPTSV